MANYRKRMHIAVIHRQLFSVLFYVRSICRILWGISIFFIFSVSSSNHHHLFADESGGWAQGASLAVWRDLVRLIQPEATDKSQYFKLVVE